MWGAIAAAAGKSIRSGTPGKRRPRPISSGPKTGRRPGGRRKLSTSEAAIRRFEARKRGGTRGRPARPTSRGHLKIIKNKLPWKILMLMSKILYR